MRAAPGNRHASGLLLAVLVLVSWTAARQVQAIRNAPSGDSRPVRSAPIVVRSAPGADARPEAENTGEPREESVEATGSALTSARQRVGTAGELTPAREVDRWILRLAEGHAGWLERSLERMGPYEEFIRSTFARRNLPPELLYVALIESGFRNDAVSSAGAVGMWQFMPATARAYGLEVSEYVDERRDPFRACEAAARHLEDLRGRFGSWHLALAAYNAGAGRIESSLRILTGRPGRTDTLYWRARSAMPAETRAYVPKLLAAVAIGGNPPAFGIREPASSLALVFEEISVPGGSSLDGIARREGIPYERLAELNPHLVRGRTPPGRRWRVRVPPRAGSRS